MDINISTVTDTAIGYVTALSTEVAVVILLTAVLFFYGIRNGLRPLVTLLLAELIAYPLYLIFPYSDHFAFDFILFSTLQTVPLLTYLVLVLFAYFSVNSFVETDYHERGLSRLMVTFLVSIAIVGNLLIVVYAISSGGELTIITYLDKIFSNATYIFWWMIASLGVLFYASR
jgi:hypothetical protein